MKQKRVKYSEHDLEVINDKNLTVHQKATILKKSESAIRSKIAYEKQKIETEKEKVEAAEKYELDSKFLGIKSTSQELIMLQKYAEDLRRCYLAIVDKFDSLPRRKQKKIFNFMIFVTEEISKIKLLYKK